MHFVYFFQLFTTTCFLPLGGPHCYFRNLLEFFLHFIADLTIIRKGVWGVAPEMLFKMFYAYGCILSFIYHCLFQNLMDRAPRCYPRQFLRILPVITNMINGLFEQGRFSSLQKDATVGPRLKKPTLDSADLKSYRPMISNINFITKLIECIAVNRFNAHANLFQIF